LGAQHLVRHAGLKSGRHRPANQAVAERISTKRRPIFIGWIAFQLGIFHVIKRLIYPAAVTERLSPCIATTNATFWRQLLPSNGIYF
jgi:hypothetical protein